MVSRLFVMSLAVGALALGSSALAQGVPIEVGEWGKVKSVDAEAGTITVEGMKDPLRVDKGTRFMLKGKQTSSKATETSINDIRPGDEVRAAYLTGQGEGPIVQVDVRKGKKSKEHKSSEAAETGTGMGSSNSQSK